MRRTIMYTEADVDGGDDVGGECGVEEDGHVEEEIVGGFGCLYVNMCEESLHLHPRLGAGCRCVEGKGIGDEHDDERV